MKPIGTILAATDFSPAAHVAVLRAAELAEARGAELTLLHVMAAVEPGTSPELLPAGFDAQERLLEAAREALAEAAATVETPRLAVRQELRAGNILDELLAASSAADLVVLGAYGTAPVRDALLGTTAERLLRKCARPVLVVKQTPLGPYECAIVPVDFSPRSAAALALAQRIAPGAETNVVHVFDFPLERILRVAKAAEHDIAAYHVHVRQQAQRELQEFIASSGAAGEHLFASVEYGYPPKVIRDMELVLKADLVAIGRSGKGTVEALLLGGVTRHLLADCACDVLVVPE